MSIIYDEFISTLLFSPDYLPDVLQWFRKQPKENGRISKACMKKLLHVISYPCWRRFLQAVEGPCKLTREDLAAAEYKLLTETGVARIESVRLLGESESAYNLSLTDEAKHIIKTFDFERFKQDKLRNCAVHLVAVAAVNAYGVIEENTFIDLFNRHMKESAEGSRPPIQGSSILLKSDELEAILAPYTELCIDVLLVGGYLVNRMLYNGSLDDIPRFLCNVSVDKYYPFDIEALMAYAASNYFELTPQIAAFLEGIEERFPEMTKGDFFLISILFVPCYLLEWPQMIEAQLCPVLKSLPREEQEKMAELFVGAVRSARNWRFKGFSADEVNPEREGAEKDIEEFVRIMNEC